ncbi:MAG: serine--tRNA ligase [Fusobacteria bacterium]|nr:serine--tRNA ligase [Fusobacteriota bacterium]
MLDIKFIRSNLERVKSDYEKRGFKADLEALISLDEKKRVVIQKVEELKNFKNTKSKEIGLLKREGKSCDTIMSELAGMNDDIKKLDDEAMALEAEITAEIMTMPNILHTSTPIGKNDVDNVEVSRFGTPKTFSFEPKAHFDLAENLDIVDFERAVKLSGSRFALFKNEGAKLERALINFMLNLHTTEHGYQEISPPFMVTRETMTGSGQLPKFEEDLYKTTDDMFLIPTAEVTLVNYRSKEILKSSELPYNMTAYTPCFRREAGSYGRDLKGLIRLHQFDKVELVKLTTPESSYEELDKLLANSEKILQLLKIPYRVVQLCSGDIGFGSSKTYDIEVWLPSQNCYREISSCSNTEEFQARRCSIRFRDAVGKIQFVHALITEILKK